MGIAKTRFRRESQGPRTIVTWSFEVDMGVNPAMRYIGLFMDDWVGKPYENGLISLKKTVEDQQ